MSNLVSVIVPTRNRHELLKETVASVAAQTHPEVELIVVDDGSDTPVEAVAREAWGTHRPADHLRVIRQAPSNGNVARNRGLKESSGDLIVFLDSDDLLAPWALEQRVVLSENYSGVIVCNAEGFLEKPGDRKILFNLHTQEDLLDRFLKLDFPWQTSGPIWPRAILEKLGGFDEQLPSWQDWDLSVRALIFGINFQWLASSDFYYRLKGDEKVTNHQMENIKHLQEGIRLMTRLEELLKENSLWSKNRSNMLESIRRYLIIKIANLHGFNKAMGGISDFPQTRRQIVRMRLVLYRAGNFFPKRTKFYWEKSIWKHSLNLGDPSRLFLRINAPQLLASNMR